MIKNNKIYQTSNYDKFTNFLGNRSVTSVKSRHHIEKLMESMKKSYLPQPIIVDENFSVLDGQHRLEAAKKLKLPIYFMTMTNLGNIVIDKEGKEYDMFQLQRQWISKAKLGRRTKH